MTNVALSVLDLAQIHPGGTARESFDTSVKLAQAAEANGYKRVWYAEHHNMKSIASSATSVLIAHIGNHTSTIRLGAGGIMLPNHSPLVIAEQFGTLETLFPGRIDLGLGRAPGSDGATMRALRRTPASAETFPQDVLELQGYLQGNSVIPGIEAVPGQGTNVPLYILGSSLFGAQLAAALGLPYAFASHFAPDHLLQAIKVYRNEYQPSETHPEPHLIAALNVIAADDAAYAREQFAAAGRQRLRFFLDKRVGPTITDDQLDHILASPQGQPIAHQMHYTAVGDAGDVRRFFEQFIETTGADELIVGFSSPQAADKIRSVEITAQAMGIAG